MQRLNAMVRISDEDAAAQCFLWRNLHLNDEPTIYQMKSMLFGTNSSPFIAQFVKNYNANIFRESHPRAVRAIIDDHYVDDYLGGEDNVQDAVQLILSVIDIHRAGGFEIRGFISNDSDVLRQLPPEVCSDRMVMEMGEKGTGQKVLGIIWDGNEDIFKFSRSTMHRIGAEILDGLQIPTKRKVLATVNSIYDPLGFMTPMTISGRIMMREIWMSGIQWDDQLVE